MKRKLCHRDCFEVEGSRLGHSEGEHIFGHNKYGVVQFLSTGNEKAKRSSMRILILEGQEKETRQGMDSREMTQATKEPAWSFWEKGIPASVSITHRCMLKHMTTR